MSSSTNQATFAFILCEGKILLTKRLDVPLWVLPGGGIDPGESPEQACIREVKEETGLSAEIVRKTHELTPINRLAEPTHLFIAIAKGELLKNSNESSENCFFDLDALPQDMFWPHRIWLDEALTKSEIVKRPLHEITWWNLFKYSVKHPTHILRFGFTLLTKNRS